MGNYRQRTMIVAVIAVRMVQASVDQVIDVVPMRNRLMTTVWTMAMRLIMTRSTMFWVAPIRIGAADFNHVFISAPFFHVLQMAMVEIIDVIFMLNGNMAAAHTMHMRLIGGGHGASFLSAGCPLQRKIGNDLDEIEDARNLQLGAFRRAREFAFPRNQTHLTAFALPSHPRPRPSAIGGVADWLVAKQAAFYIALAATLRSVKADGSALWALMGISLGARLLWAKAAASYQRSARSPGSTAREAVHQHDAACQCHPAHKQAMPAGDVNRRR